MVPAKNNAPQLEGGHSTKIGGVWRLKHEIISPKFYELLINKYLKGDTDMELKSFYSYINMCINAAIRLQEYILPDYQYIKRHYEFEE